MRIAYYITSHGFGHAIRSLEVIRNLMERNAGLELYLVSDIPDFLVRQNLKTLPHMVRRRPDVGMIQHDSLRIDMDATLEALIHHRRREREIVAEEVDFLRREKIQGIVADIPFLPFRAAAICNLPSVGMSNFTWDWIYGSYADEDSKWQPLVEWVRENYRFCGIFLQLPMHGDCSSCPNIIDVPLVSRRAMRSIDEVRSQLGCDSTHNCYLISFSDLELDDSAIRRLESMEKIIFLFKHPLHFPLKNGRSLDGLDLTYADVVAAVDGVITKPGYGIVADCIASGTPLIYTDRGWFVEYEILVREIKKHLKAVYMTSADLYSGNWSSAIDELEGLPEVSNSVQVDGAVRCADLIVEHISRGGDHGGAV
jgi:hypothetical protein